MARRSPAQVRANRHTRSHRDHVRPARPAPVPEGVSARGIALIRQLEGNEFRPGMVHEATTSTIRRLRERAYDDRREDEPDAYCLPCCASPAELLHVVRRVLSVLPERDARNLRRRLGDLDD